MYMEGRVRTSALGWRIVAAGVLILIFAMSAFTNKIGPDWFAITMFIVGTGVIVVGRQR